MQHLQMNRASRDFLNDFTLRHRCFPAPRNDKLHGKLWGMFINVALQRILLIAFAVCLGMQPILGAQSSLGAQASSLPSTESSEPTEQEVESTAFPPKKEDTTGSTTPPGSASRPESAGILPASEPTTPSPVVIKIALTQKLKAINHFILYPYPVKPPRNVRHLTRLPKNMKQLKQAMLDSCYSNRISKDRPTSGRPWRWRYIYMDIVKKTRSSPPHTIFSAYQWIDDVTPLAISEIKKINAAERERLVRYNKAVEFFEVNGQEIENEATMRGLRPIEVQFNDREISRGHLPAGRWWLVGIRKVTGLMFYWQIPINVVPGKPISITLDEWNALLVHGNW